MVLYYTNKEIFVLSAVGCMDTEPDGLESVLAGNEEGAKGCCLSVDMAADGVAVLSSDGYCVANDGTRLSITMTATRSCTRRHRSLSPPDRRSAGAHLPGKNRDHGT